MPPLLAALRAADIRPDWRRDRPDAEAAGLAARLGQEATTWPRAERLEAEALVAKRARDAAAAIDALSALAGMRAERRRWAMAELATIAERWVNVEGRMAGEGLAELRRRAEAALARLVAERPHAAEAHVALATVLEAAQGIGAAVDHLARAAAQGAPVTDSRLRLLARALEHGPHEAHLRRALAEPGEAAGGSAATWAAFRVHRAVACAMTAAVLPAGDRRAALVAALPAAESDIGGTLEAALAGVAALPDGAAARLLRGIAEGRLFRHCPLPGAEAARQRLVGAILAFCRDEARAAEARRSLAVTLSTLLPDTERFWTDRTFRHAASHEMAGLASGFEEPHRSWQLGRFAFAREDYDAAAACFAAAGGAGAATHVDFRAVPAILAARGAAPLLGDEGGRFEVIVGDPAAAAVTVIVAANDLYLLRHGRGFAQGLARVAPGAHLHLHLIGDPAALREEVAAIAGAGRGLGLSLSSEPVTIDAPFYHASARFLRLPAWRARFGGAIVVSDIDMVWREAPGAFLARRMGDADVGLSLSAKVRTGRKAGLGYPVNVYPLPLPWMAVGAWVLALAPTPGARRFAALLAPLMDASLRAAAALSGRCAWFVDQNALCAAYAHAVRAEPAIRFADLGLPAEIAAPLSPPGFPGPRGRHWIGGD